MRLMSSLFPVSFWCALDALSGKSGSTCAEEEKREDEDEESDEEIILECRVYRNGKYCLVETLKKVDEFNYADNFGSMMAKISKQAKKRESDVDTLPSAEDIVKKGIKKEDSDLENEIILGANKLESLLNIKLNHFAFTFGDINSFSKQALDIAKSRFEYIYTGMRGSNSKNLNPLAIRRDTIAINDTNNLIGSFLIGAADFVYNKNLKLYESWIS